MSQGLSEEYLNEREAIDSLFNFEGEYRKARWKKKGKNTAVFEVDIDNEEYVDYEEGEDYDDEDEGEVGSNSQDIFKITISMKIPKVYPKKPPFELKLMKIRNIEQEHVSDLRKKIMRTIKVNRGKIVCMEIIEVAKSFLEELKDLYLNNEQSPTEEYSTVDLIEIARLEKEKRKTAFLKKKNKERKKEEKNLQQHQPQSGSNIVYIMDPKLEKEKKMKEMGLDKKMKKEMKEKEEKQLMDNISLELGVRKSTKMKVKKVDLSEWRLCSYKPNGISLHHKTKRAKGIFSKESHRTDLTMILRRIDYTITRVGHSLVLIGGRSGKRKYDDIIRFDFRSKEVSYFKGLFLSTRKTPFDTPFLTDHISFCHKNNLAVIYPDTAARRMSVFCISDVNKKPFVGVNVEKRNVPPNIKHKVYQQRRAKLINEGQRIPVLREYAYTWVRSFLYVFGGSLNSTFTNLTNRLFQISFRGENAEQEPTWISKEIIPVKREAGEDDEEGFALPNVCPCPRRGHRMAALHYNLYVFGGIDELGNYLNDLYCYNFSTDNWSEIHIGFKPSPMAYFSMYNTGPSFTIFGGRGKSGEVSNQMYSYDTRERKFYVMNPLNRSASECLGRSGQITVRVTADSSFTSSGRIYVGGRSHRDGVLADMCFIEYSNDPGKRLQVLGYLDECRKKRFFVDMHFIMQVTVKKEEEEEEEENKDGKKKEEEEEEETEGEDVIHEEDEEEGEEEMKMEELYAHACILSIRCPSFFEYLMKNAELEENYGGGEDEEKSNKNRIMYHIRIGRHDPILGNQPELLHAWLRFLYTGDVIVESNVGKFLDLARKFSPERLYPVLTKLCSKRRRYLDICGEIVNQICDDYRKLYTSDEKDGVLMHQKEEEEEEEEEVLPPAPPPPNIDDPYEDSDSDSDSGIDFDNLPGMNDLEIPELPSPEEEKKDYSRYYHSDLRLVFADGTIKHVHRVFLCQSKYFKSMLQSNFKEATQSEIEFDQFNKEAILDILSYIYTGFLEMNPQNCVGVLIYSLQFELLEVSTACRRVVEEYLEDDNVIELLNLAELYVDQTLRAICKSYIVRRYDDITVLPGYGDIESRTRQEMFQEYSKRKLREKKKKMKKSRQRRRRDNN